MTRRKRKGSRRTHKDQMRIEAAVRFLDGICKRTDWIDLRESGEARDERVSGLLTDFMRSRMYLLDPSLDCPFLSEQEIEWRRVGLIGMGRRCIELCRTYRLRTDQVEDAINNAIEEYEVIVDMVRLKNDGIMVRRLVDPDTGNVLYDSDRDKRRPIYYDPLSWLLTGIKENCVPARKMPKDIPEDEFEVHGRTRHPDGSFEEG